MIRIDKLTKTFDKDLLTQPVTALNNLSFTIPEGKITGFLGRNGAGKTTLIKVMMDFIRATSGQIHFDKKLGKSKKEIFKNIGYLPERPSFYPYLTGNEFLYFISELSGKKRQDILLGIKKYAERLRIHEALNRKIGTYSKGMVQRIGFLTNIVCDPLVYILDEPLSGLDPIGRKEYKDILRDLRAQNKTIFFSSHIVSDVEEISEHIILIDKGQLLYDGSLKKLREKKGTDNVSISFWKDGEMKIVDCTQGEVKEKLKVIISSGFEIYEVTRAQQKLEEIVYNLK
ncbi:MAG: ABC transporter ATP-binding protein [Halobacteriovoraceae bacterium]|nr:ABC transporter ATP-binding protein [Halobacteriovoraceae bacterium]